MNGFHNEETGVMQEPTSERIRESLRSVPWPGFDQNVVSAGFIKSIEVRDKAVFIGFESRTRNADKVATMEAGIREAVTALPGVERVEVRYLTPVIDQALSVGGKNTPLQAEVAADGVMPEPDPMLGVVDTPDLGPRWDGKRPGRNGKVSTTYEGPIPVHQWDIDPTASSEGRGEAHITLGEWEYRMWWQTHPEELVYVSIQAMFDDTISHEESARIHPVGRAIAVNLVYDPRRTAIIAIYGTASDFRPFVEAFRKGYGLPDHERVVMEKE